ARIEASDDALAADNEAVAWLDSRDDINVTIVSEDATTLQKLLSQDPSLHLTIVKPSAYNGVTGGIVVFDRWLPDNAPSRPALFVAPPSASAWLGQPGDVERSARWSTPGTHPVVSGVDPFTVDVKRVRRFDV